MSYFDKTRYIRVLLFLVPISITLIYFGIKIFLNEVDKLPSSKGEIEYILHKKEYFKYCECTLPAVKIKLKEKTEFYITGIAEYKKAITSSLSKGDIITIWTHTEKRKNEIAQIKKGDEIIIPYEKGEAVAWGFLIAGIITGFIAIGYLIKYPEDLLGKKKKGNDYSDQN